jgi:hypothetical protein
MLAQYVRVVMATITTKINQPGAPLQDCPECASAGSVLGGVCQICFAELDENLAPVRRRVRERRVRAAFTSRSPSRPSRFT